MAFQSVYAIANNKAQAERLIQALIDAGCNPQEISFLSSQGEEFKGLSSDHGMSHTRRDWRTEERVTDYPTSTTMGSSSSNWREDRGELGTEKNTKAPEGAATGGLTGGIIGGTLGLLAGIGALAIPGLGPFVAAGPLMGLLSGIGAGSTIGGITGALIGAGFPEFEAKRYEDHLKKGGVLISVRAKSDEEAKRLKDILNQHGAQDVSVASEVAGSKTNKRK